jgi:hypothetical protein
MTLILNIKSYTVTIWQCLNLKSTVNWSIKIKAGKIRRYKSKKATAQVAFWDAYNGCYGKYRDKT